jgi:hypothetical protein
LPPSSRLTALHCIEGRSIRPRQRTVGVLGLGDERALGSSFGVDDDGALRRLLEVQRATPAIRAD